MLDGLYVVATSWLLTAVSYTARMEQIAADEAVLKAAAVKNDDASLLGFFKRRTLPDIDRGQVDKLIRQLGSESYRLREQALTDLINRGPAAVRILREAIKESDLETVRRLEKCLAVIQERDVAPDVVPAAVRLLAAHEAVGAVDAMLAYIPYAESDAALDETRSLLAQLSKKDTKAHALLVAHLGDALVLRRAAAAEALCQSGTAEEKAQARKLLADADAHVRMRVASAFIHAGDKDAVPILIDTLPRLAMTQAWQAEDLLCRLANGHAPPGVALGTDEAGRSKSRAAWLSWWQAHAAKIDLAKLPSRQMRLGYTLVVLLDMGRVMELGPDNQVRWQVDNLNYPLDVQYLPEGRVLVAEYYASRVSERDLKGNIVWERQASGPLVAQRLPGGNTFIATENLVQEIDRSGKTAFSFTIDDGDRIMKAVKLPGGDVACLVADLLGTRAARVVRYDTTGKELRSYKVELGARLSGGRIYMEPDGHVLIPHHAEDKVIEYDGDGKAVWEVAVEKPVAAMRLPNGNVLVTTMLPQRGAVEFDRDGHEVWSYRSTTRVTRALRR